MFSFEFLNKLWFVFLPLILVLEISKNLCSFPNCLLSKEIMPKDWILREIYVYVEFFVRWLVSIIGAYEKWISINILVLAISQMFKYLWLWEMWFKKEEYDFRMFENCVEVWFLKWLRMKNFKLKVVFNH